MGERLLAQGADIILPVAGETGLGTAVAVAARGGAYVIGVDTDWAITYPEYAPVILTSVQKRLDVGVIAAVEAIIDGRFAGGAHVGTLENGGVGLAPFHTLTPSITPELQADLAQITAGIIAGEIPTMP